MDGSWPTLKVQLRGYYAEDKSIEDDVKKRMAELHSDMYEKIHYVEGPKQLKLWLVRMMHNSLQVHASFESVPSYTRTYRTTGRIVDIRDVVGEITEKIQNLWAVQDSIDLPRLKQEFEVEFEAGGAVRQHEHEIGNENLAFMESLLVRLKAVTLKS